VLVGELLQLLSALPESSSVLVFIRRPGANEPDVADVVEVVDLPTEDALVLYVDIGD
jgi:hypothetical protein